MIRRFETEPKTGFDDMFDNIESKYNVRIPKEICQEYGNVLETRFWEDEPVFQCLAPNEIVRAKTGISNPELLPFIVTENGDAICLKMDTFSSNVSGYWFYYDHETTYVASLGRSFFGVMRFLLGELEARGIEREGYGEPIPARIRRVSRQLIKLLPQYAGDL